MTRLKPIRQVDLIGRTIKYVRYIYNKSRIIFKLDNDLEIMIISGYGDSPSDNTIFTKNRKPIDYNYIKNVKIKDVGWDQSYYLFIVSVEADVYRTRCFVGETAGLVFIYNYTQYKRDKLVEKEKKDRLKDKVKSFFNRNSDYVRI